MPNYFDYAAATPILPEVLEVMTPFFSDKFYNPSAIYLAALDVKKDLQAARASVASVLGAKSSEIIFTAGGTEANNLAIHGTMGLQPGSHIITTTIEHESVLRPAQQYNHSLAKVDSVGRLQMDDLATKITDETTLISVMLANNEIGTIQDVRAVTRLAAEVNADRRRHGIMRPLYVHTDACQAVNYLDLHTSRLGVDLLTINGGKIYGPKQTGALFVKTGVTMAPLIKGGGQEKGLRSGSENVANCIGLARAMEIVRHSVNIETSRLSQLQAYIIDELVDDKKIHLNGPHKNHRLVNNINLTIDGLDNERLLMELDERGIQIATGSACSASSDEPSHVLAAIGLSDQQIRNSIRITLGRHTTHQQCEYLVKSIKELVAKA